MQLVGVNEFVLVYQAITTPTTQVSISSTRSHRVSRVCPPTSTHNRTLYSCDDPQLTLFSCSETDSSHRAAETSWTS